MDWLNLWFRHLLIFHCWPPNDTKLKPVLSDGCVTLPRLYPSYSYLLSALKGLFWCSSFVFLTYCCSNKIHTLLCTYPRSSAHPAGGLPPLCLLLAVRSANHRCCQLVAGLQRPHAISLTSTLVSRSLTSGDVKAIAHDHCSDDDRTSRSKQSGGDCQPRQ